ncbi:treslin [Chanos chanos]|uniref:Treslin n=1 Tax=Chanos chanos TaxID=29144 RepID=A0A6J2ULG4_CHACN|nr:treslin [Chanos chanos]
MASHNVVFLIDVESRGIVNDTSGSSYFNNHHVKQCVLRILLNFAFKYGLEKVRWGYRFIHTRTVKSSTLITRGTDFKELTDKAFQDFEEELINKFNLRRKSSSLSKQQSSPAGILQNALKEIVLDFQWDRPDITSPTKPTVRLKRSSGSGKHVSAAEDDHSGLGENILFLLSECPRSMTELREFLSLTSGGSGRQKDLPELVLPKGLVDMLFLRKIVLHWINATLYSEVTGVSDTEGAEVIAERLRQVGGRVTPMCSFSLPLTCHEDHSGLNTVKAEGRGSCLADSIIDYILSPEETYRKSFPVFEGVLCFGTGEDAQSCPVSLEPVSCGQRCLLSPVTVTLRGVLQSLDTLSLIQVASGCWLLQCQNTGQSYALVHSLLKELSTQACYMMTDIRAGDLVCSALLSPLSSSVALLTLLQPVVTQEDQALTADLILPETVENSSDLPDVVSSVLGVMFNIMDNEKDDHSEPAESSVVPDWAGQELKQQSASVWSGLAQTWFPHSDASGVSCHLMESMRLLHAAPERGEEMGEGSSDTHPELISQLSELYQSCASEPSTSVRNKKRGTQRTPVRQKMKSMSRSLQMLNVARLNAMAQKTQADPGSSGLARGSEQPGKRRSGDRTKAGSSISRFKNEEDLFSHLKGSYQSAVADRDSSLLTQVHGLLSAVKTYLKSSQDQELLPIMERNLLKTSKCVRLSYGNTPDVGNKIRECKLQSLLRLELCRHMSSDGQVNADHVEEFVEEVADMLRIISLTKDPVYLTAFMQEEILPAYLNSIPKALAEVYHSLGTQLPEALVTALPSDFFSDDSVLKDGVSPNPSVPSVKNSQSSEVGEHLEELRNRSARKRRNGMITRHKSMTEASQALRQIEVPRKSTRLTKPKVCVPAEKTDLDQMPPQKQTAQEVTKVRRNLFNQEMLSPSKKTKLPRSQSVSVLEGNKKRKRSHVDDGKRHTLLTKKVSETPLHKQVSSRLLHRQMTGRRSDATNVCVVEESPVKPADLRRSPRIKNLTRRHSSFFYSSSQPRSRNLNRVLSSSQLTHSESKKGSYGVNVNVVRSPVRLLFGATQSPGCHSVSSQGTRTRRRSPLGFRHSDVFESPRKTSEKSSHGQYQSAAGSRTPKTPCSSARAQASPLSKSPGVVIGDSGMTLRGSPFRSPAWKSLVLETPHKASPLKSILKTPVKNSPNGSCGLQSPNTRTARKSVTWSPSPRKPRSERSGIPFKVPESPQALTRSSPRLLTPKKADSAFKYPTDMADVFKTLEKVPHREKNISPEIIQHKTPESPGLYGTQTETQTFPFQNANVAESPDYLSPPAPDIRTPSKSHRQMSSMLKCSGRTPVKDSTAVSPCKTRTPSTKCSSELQRPVNLLEGLSETKCLKSVAEEPYRQRLRSQSSGNLATDEVRLIESLPNQGMNILSPERHLKTADNLTPQGASVQGDGEGSTDSQGFESSQFSTTTTDEDSIDISEASVVKTQLTGGIKMNISFSRKASKVFEFIGKGESPVETTPSRSYGFRQTADRRQREAAARLGYSPGPPKFSTPRASGTPAQRRRPAAPNSLSYQVEMEMQASGLPKLKFKRTDSFNVGNGAVRATTPNATSAKASHIDSPLTLCAKHRDPSYLSPSLCTRGTPAKGTPGKGGTQTYICQSYTPTQVPSNASPPGPGDTAPWTPSPQRRGHSTPESLNSWPRKKRARMSVLWSKDQGMKGEPLSYGMEILEDPELEGVFRLQEVEELKESVPLRMGEKPLLRASRNHEKDQLGSPESMNWTETLGQHSGGSEHQRFVTPPNSKVKKPVSASGIIALTQSPLLYSGKTTTSERCTIDGTEPEVDTSPFSQPQKRTAHGRTYSRKRLLS